MPDVDPKSDAPTFTPATAADMLANVSSLASKTLGKHAQIIDSVALNRSGSTLSMPVAENAPDDDDDEGLYFGIAIAKLPHLLGVRVNITLKDDTVELRSDVSVEYTWAEPVNYLDEPLVDFVSREGIPRALTTASAILSDIATSVGRSIENSSLRMHSELVEYFQKTYDTRIWKSHAEDA